MTRAEQILHELVSDPALAWRVLDGARRVVHVVGPWLPGRNADGDPVRWERRYPGGGTATWTTYPATEAMLRDADSRLLAARPMLSLVGRYPCAAPGIVPPCDELHPMALAAGLSWPPPEKTTWLRCELPAGHLMACGGRGPDGRPYTASNAVERRERLKPAPPRSDGGA